MTLLKKIDHTGRITLPKDLCGKFGLKKDDQVEITHDEQFIKIRKHQPEFVCAVTGKITDQGQTIGNAFISYEGIEQILQEQEHLKEKEKEKK
ncbi:TPA: AbrB/MazE/SpoVT family DNA-binding domain-containing protein [Bacillus cereus]|uniref:AbrB/MazE/SpoVT family DNA-binding domain-containing protein n=1 Tax=Bacillus cereus group sp. BfR-BA-01353 TaxID=2920316 RepID=UPI001F57F367|nr:AbrB/MazE/SpoVT family DNA-binding domain-containing protein [Bacillus cereus group sp. BfR-BA-01353]MEC2974069.1 AbrB/MazE/SpoVT family DNA-binding domain-containing protein [Bacillus cereus]HDR7001879.1 AbrB/MazE/SpoVT family DNA-binding domain-containing protein [Bacillus cereus]HDR7021186.1 AbrB/MazE/SpoVT family DNA-binding domain-containing protein [Bacillus cereus]